VRKHLSAAVALASLCLVASPTLAANGNIGLFFDEGAALCAQTIPCNGTATIYVYALLQGASGTGITGAEYQVTTGLTTAADGYLFNEVFDPAATTLGTGAFNPIDPGARGINMSYPSCQIGDGTKVLLETVAVFNFGCSTAETRLRVEKHVSPSNQFFQCPLFTLCDDPVFTKVCLGSNQALCRNPEPPFPTNATCSTSGQAYINPANGHNCLVGVQAATWGQVKGLYGSN
jgi:hypothetical protein